MTWSMKAANFSHSHLADAMNVNDTAVKLLDSSAFPTTFPFNIVIEDEVMVCVAHKTTNNTFIVLRGAESTTAAIHDVGTEVAQQITAGYMADLYRRTIDAEVDSDTEKKVTHYSSKGVVYESGLGGLLVTEKGAGADMSVDVAAGVAQMMSGGSFLTLTKVATTNVAVTAAHATLPRIDAVRIQSSGTIDVVAGTPSEFPVSPFNAGMAEANILLADIEVAPAVTSIVNADITDRRSIIPNLGGVDISCRVYNSANQAIGTAAFTKLTFDSEEFDTDAMHAVAGATSRLTCKTAGKFLITANVWWAANATGTRIVRIKLNDTTYIASVQYPVNSAAYATVQSLSTIYNLAVSDYIEVDVYQDSGGNLNSVYTAQMSPEFMMVKIA